MSECVAIQIRTWNIAHGRDVPPSAVYGHARRKLLAEMCAVMVEDAPDIVLLQEVPIWAAALLHERTGMGVTLAHAYGAHVPFLHVPLPLAAGAAIGRALPDVARTQFEGQGQALLYCPDLLLVSARRVQLNERRRLRGEPRVAQLVRLRHRRAGRELVVGNVHADHGGAPEQLEKAGFVLERFARGAPMLLGGDLNAGPKSAGVRALVRRGWIEESGEASIDHLFVRGLQLEWPATRWLPQRRDLHMNGSRPLRLSDHDPVDAVVSFV
ncbi:MAG TPA: endonuclease/exonuclease/phosphatase family protein [Gaiellales bacterium]|nr:endonuclease/exonuclease/phosphatase family protein [Gaiellales bacterium]